MACSFIMLQYNQAPFKVAAFFSWVVVLSDHDHMEELRRAPSDTVSFEEAAVDASLAFFNYSAINLFNVANKNSRLHIQ